MKNANDLKHRGIYLLPNLFTTAGLFAGFYAIVAAMNGQFEPACIAIFVAMVADMLDGRVARMTNTASAFGAEYDSLTDIVAFGLAPALIIYTWGLAPYGKIGWLIAFLYSASAALRLARFNSQLDKADKRFFTGLPTPAAAGMLVGFVWLEYELNMGLHRCYSCALFTVLAALCMVSTLRYYSFKDIDFKGKVSFVAMLAMVLIFVGISVNPPLVLFITFLLYALSGPLWTLWRIRGFRGLRRFVSIFKRDRNR